MDGTLTGSFTPGQSGPGNNGHEGVLSFRAGASPSDGLVSYAGHSLQKVLPLC